MGRAARNYSQVVFTFMPQRRFMSTEYDSWVPSRGSKSSGAMTGLVVFSPD